MKHYLSTQALPWICLVGTIYGANMVAARFCLGQFAPLTLISLRLLAAALIYLAAFLCLPTWRLPRDGRFWLKAGISGLLSTALPLSGFLAAMQYISSGMTGLLDTLVPVFVAILAPVFLQEKLSARRALGTLVAFAGTGMLYLRGESGLAQLGAADGRGYAFALAAVLSAATGILYGRIFLRDEDAVQVSAVRMIVSAGVMLPLAAFTSGFDLSRVNAVGAGVFVYLTLVGTLLAFLLDFYILKRFGAFPAAQSIYLIPLAATALGALLLKEQISPTMLAGMGIIFCGLGLVQSERRSPQAK